MRALKQLGEYENWILLTAETTIIFVVYSTAPNLKDLLFNSKIMKLLFYFFVIVCSCNTTQSFSQTTKVIGELEGTTAKLNVDQQALISNFNKNLLEQSGINGNFSSVNLEKYRDNLYLLVFKGKDYKSSFLVVKGEANENGNIALRAVVHVSCTTSDCASEQFGCVPDGSVGGSSCTPCANKGKCTKTVSNKSLLD